MPALWDTSLLSRLAPRSEVLEYVLDRFADGAPVAAAAPSVLEIAYGYQRRAGESRRHAAMLAWFRDLMMDRTLTVVAFDRHAALVAGRLRGVIPHAPPARRDRRSKTMRQASWLIDIQIAATAFAGGYDVATQNRADFEPLAMTLAQLYPRTQALEIAGGPF